VRLISKWKRDTVPFFKKATEILGCYVALRADAYCLSSAEAEAECRQATHDARKTPLTYGNAPGTNQRRALHITPETATKPIPTDEPSRIPANKRPRCRFA
jgi:hypothetical protein